MQLRNLRMGLAGRLASFQLTTGHTVTVLQMIDRYRDSHWAGYQELPKPGATKRAQVLALHEDLTAVMNEVGVLYNSLREAGATPCVAARLLRHKVVVVLKLFLQPTAWLLSRAS